MIETITTLYDDLLFTLPSTTPPLKVYAIADSARDESLKERILASDIAYLDLWHEELWENELSYPLYLVELKAKDPLTGYLLSKHTECIATYMISPYSLQTLQSYYSMFTYVDIEIQEAEPQKGIFGFYDPNILPNYIQTLYSQEKIDEFFAGVTMWLVPDVKDIRRLYIAYRDKDHTHIEDVWLDLEPFLHKSSPSLNFDSVTFPTEPNLDLYTHDVVIDYRQIEIFDKMEQEKFVNGVLEEFEIEGYLFHRGKEANRELAFNLFHEAKDIGILSEAGIYRYILLGLTALKPMRELVYYQHIADASNEEAKIEIMDQIISEIISIRRGS